METVKQNTQESQAYLESLHLKQLLRLRNFFYTHSPYEESYGERYMAHFYFKSQRENPDCYITKGDLREELSKREHLPKGGKTTARERRKLWHRERKNK